MSITAYKLLRADLPFTDALAEKVAEAIADGWQPFGQPVLLGQDKLVQAVVQGAPDGGGSGSVTIADVEGLQDALDAKADTSALSEYATTSALTSGLDGKLGTTATAAAATKLATPRNIAGHAFDGTADVVITASDVGAQPAA